MQKYDRRQFLARMSAGLAVAGAAAYLPRAGASAAGPGEASGSKGYDGHGDNIVPQPRDVAEGPVVAYVRDAPSGEISIFVGSREITVHDPSIAATLAHAASKGV